MVLAPRPAGSHLQTGGTTAQYWVSNAEVKRDATQIWHTGINAISMDVGEDVAKLEVLGELAPCLGGEVSQLKHRLG